MIDEKNNVLTVRAYHLCSARQAHCKHASASGECMVRGTSPPVSDCVTGYDYLSDKRYGKCKTCIHLEVCFGNSLTNPIGCQYYKEK